MPNLQLCSDCKAEVSFDARRCPKCGAVLPAGKRLKRTIVSWIVTIAVGVPLIFFTLFVFSVRKANKQARIRMAEQNELVVKRVELMRLENERDNLSRQLRSGEISISRFRKRSAAVDDSIIRLSH